MFVLIYTIFQEGDIFSSECRKEIIFVSKRCVTFCMHQRSLNSAFIIHLLERIISKLSTCENSIFWLVSVHVTVTVLVFVRGICPYAIRTRSNLKIKFPH